ncbi:MAG: 3-deoxy-7-phosphoheptulonate synthase [Chlamydiales bacterium]|jgi:3-deoxy-7-phosphoheptulonate synthase
MILTMSGKATVENVEQLRDRLIWMGMEVHVQLEKGKHVLAIVGGVNDSVSLEGFKLLPYVEEVAPFKKSFKLAGREWKGERLLIEKKGFCIGGKDLVIMAGPCAIESEEQIHETAEIVAKGGATVLRGGAYKPRSSPYSFQGLGEQGLAFMRDAGKAHGLLTVSEIMEPETIDCICKYVDILQVGARNMQNFSLLKELGKIDKPILLKRGMSATYEELLMAAEYIMSGGNQEVILCERGIRTFEDYTRNTLDIAAVPVLKELSHLPVIVDPSHGTGIRYLVAPMAQAAAAAGADGIIVEVHPEPDKSVSDAKQTLSPKLFYDMTKNLAGIRSLAKIAVQV